MKEVYLLFSGPGENSWNRLKSSKYFHPLRSELNLALVEYGDVSLILVNGEVNLRQRVAPLVGDLSEHLIPGSFDFRVFVQHELYVTVETDWASVYFGYYKGQVLLPAFVDLVTSPDLSKDFQGVVEHLREIMKNKRYGTST